MQLQDSKAYSSPRPATARRALFGAGLLGIIADPLLRNGPWGFGLLLWMAAFAIVVISLVRQSGQTLSHESRIWLGVAILFAAGLSWRDSGLLLFFDVLAMLAALTLLAMTMNGVPVAGLAIARVRELTRAAFGTALDVAFGVVPLMITDAELDAGLRPPGSGKFGRIAKALVITAPVLLVFASARFARADPLFGSFLTCFPISTSRKWSRHVVVAGSLRVGRGGLAQALASAACKRGRRSRQFVPAHARRHRCDAGARRAQRAFRGVCRRATRVAVRR